jgi:hypothetical protein
MSYRPFLRPPTDLGERDIERVQGRLSVQLRQERVLPGSVLSAVHVNPCEYSFM